MNRSSHARNPIFARPSSVLKQVTVIAALALLAIPAWTGEQTPTKPSHATGAAVTGAVDRATQPAESFTLKGECVFGKNKDVFTAKLTLSSNDTYTVAYSANWKGKESTWKGTLKSDLKGDVTGDGTNGAIFDYSGKFVGGSAQCSYKERGGRGRSGTLTLTR